MKTMQKQNKIHFHPQILPQKLENIITVTKREFIESLINEVFSSEVFWGFFLVCNTRRKTSLNT